MNKLNLQRIIRLWLCRVFVFRSKFDLILGEERFYLEKSTSRPNTYLLTNSANNLNYTRTTFGPIPDRNVLLDNEYIRRQNISIEVPDYFQDHCVDSKLLDFYKINVSQHYRKTGYIHEPQLECSCYKDLEAERLNFISKTTNFHKFIVLLYVLIFILGTFENLLSLIIMLSYNRNRKASSRYNSVDLVLACICFSDLLLSINTPLVAATTLENGFFPLKNYYLTCKLHGVMCHYCYFTGIFYLTLLSYYRYKIISSSTCYRLTNSTEVASLLMIFIFIPILTFFLLMPYMLFFGLSVPKHYNDVQVLCHLDRHDMQTCSFHTNERVWLIVYQVSKVLFGIIIPLTILIITGILIKGELKKKLMGKAVVTNSSGKNNTTNSALTKTTTSLSMEDKRNEKVGLVQNSSSRLGVIKFDKSKRNILGTKETLLSSDNQIVSEEESLSPNMTTKADSIDTSRAELHYGRPSLQNRQTIWQRSISIFSKNNNNSNTNVDSNPPTSKNQAQEQINHILKLVVWSFLICWLPNCLSTTEYVFSVLIQHHYNSRQEMYMPFYYQNRFWGLESYHKGRKVLHELTVVLRRHD